CQHGDEATGDAAAARARTGWLGRTIDRLPSQRRRELPALHLGRGALPLALVARQTAVPSVESLDRFQLRSPDGGLSVEALRELSASSLSADAAIPGSDAAEHPGSL